MSLKSDYVYLWKIRKDTARFCVNVDETPIQINLVETEISLSLPLSFARVVVTLSIKSSQVRSMRYSLNHSIESMDNCNRNTMRRVSLFFNMKSEPAHSKRSWFARVQMKEKCSSKSVNDLQRNCVYCHRDYGAQWLYAKWLSQAKKKIDAAMLS